MFCLPLFLVFLSKLIISQTCILHILAIEVDGLHKLESNPCIPLYLSCNSGLEENEHNIYRRRVVLIMFSIVLLLMLDRRGEFKTSWSLVWIGHTIFLSGQDNKDF